MTIRLEQPKDYREVENLTREAFWNVYRPGCTEHYVLNQYRNNPDFIPELDFVMEEDGRIIGHVMYSKAEIVKEDGSVLPAWTFGPISIHPDCKRKGYGLKLLQYSLEKARAMGIGVLCMEGNIDFYGHAGFVVASTLGIHYHAEPKEAEVPYFLAQELIPGYLAGVEGTYHTPKGYYVADADPAAFEAYEATFPKKVKELREGQLPLFCQSCGMPLTAECLGTNADGSPNYDYCMYCYKDGAFTADSTMEEMIEFCAQFVDQYNEGSGQHLTCEEYKELMHQFFPHLKRWSLPAEQLPTADQPVMRQLIDEINALRIEGLPVIDKLYVNPGAYVNMEYDINGNKVKLLDDGKNYFTNQIDKGNGRCIGIACDENCILVSEYGELGADPVLILFKTR